ncbi:MAG: CorA family divalent cation transporter [Candidatus Pacebacteria bacterium]|nr:CorA family divalent cation transporter [Candidatus Paceibacterota bacterium]
MNKDFKNDFRSRKNAKNPSENTVPICAKNLSEPELYDIISHMISTIKHNDITWVNAISPSVKEISELAEKYGIIPKIAEEMASLTMHPKVELYENYIYLVLHFPTLKSDIGARQALKNDKRGNLNGNNEIDFVIGRNFILTVQYSIFPPLEELFKNAKAKKKFHDDYFKEDAGILGFKIIKELLGVSEIILEQLFLKISRTEELAFDGFEKETIKKISVYKRDLLNFRRSCLPHYGIIFSFEQKAQEFFGTYFGKYSNTLSSKCLKIKNLMENASETLESLRQTSESLLTMKTNEIMKTLTIIAFITFPLTLLASLFGMNTIFTPILGVKGDFWIIIIIMAVAVAGMLAFFKSKKWL